jgi:hypothetical protein
MGRILEFENFRATEEYRGAVRDLNALLEGHAQELATMALNLAAAGAWKIWDAAQPAGSVLNLDPDDLKDTGDDLVRRVMELCDRIEELRAETAGEA